MTGRLGAYYFLLLAAIGGLNPWLAVVLDDAGATGEQTALILAAFPVGVLLAGPGGAWIADRTGRSVRVLRIAAVLSAACTAAMIPAGGLLPLGLAVLGLALVRAPLPPVADMVTVRDRGMGGYGPIRAWGSVGFVGAALLVGAALDARPRVPLEVGAVAMVGVAAVTFALPSSRPEGAGEAATPRRPRAAWSLLAHPVIAALCVVAVLHRGTIGFYDQFYARHTVDALGLPGWVPGVSIALGVAVEVGIMAAGRALLARFGAYRLVLVAIASQIPRWWLTATLTDPAGLIAVQLLHGVGFGAWWVGGVALVVRSAPEGSENTAQGVFIAAGHGAGSFLALGIAAAMLDGAGTGAAFRLLAVLSAAAFVLAASWLRRVVPRP